MAADGEHDGPRLQAWLTSHVSRCSKIRPSSFSRKVVSPQYGLISALNQGLILPS